MSFRGISVESLVTVLYGLLPMLLPPGHSRRRFDTASGTSWHFLALFYLANTLTQILRKKVGKKNVPFKNYKNLKKLASDNIPSF